MNLVVAGPAGTQLDAAPALRDLLSNLGEDQMERKENIKR